MVFNVKAGRECLGTDVSNDTARIQVLGALRATESIQDYLSFCRKWRKIERAAVDDERDVLRVALLSGATTDFLELPLRAELDSFGLRARIHRPDFNTHVAELLDPASATAGFSPQIAVLLLGLSDIREWPTVGDTEADVATLADRFADLWLNNICATFNRETGAEIILGNLHLPPTSSTGHLSRRLPWDRTSFVRRINQLLTERAPKFVHLLDVELLSARHGVQQWFDPRFWYHAKQPVSFDCMIPLVRDTAGIIAAIYGKTLKCIVLDLDNTLWGGVVGDDGVNGIKVGQGSAEGEAFLAFQNYLLELKARGILLAVASKNEEANARAPFDKLDDMALKFADFVSFKANWGPKPDSIAAIAKELNIGLDSIVFVDDNPAERALVRQSLPEVRVLELGDDPSEYPYLLSRSGWLETIEITSEDRKKSEQYAANRSRTELAESAVDYDGYLRSLNQKAVIRPFEPEHLDRITQLINKTNQFNLTTQRMTRSEVEALAASDTALTAYMRLKDTFGDNGLISVAAGTVDGDTLTIDLWLMSCRVFKRGAEFAMANYLMQEAARRGISHVRGIYRPTAKNGLVETLYADLNFEKDGVTEDGVTTWSRTLAGFEPVPVSIDIVEDFA
ncbi:HAD-IIIC family phosphatase [Ruegeria arenilitoris]|uniref:HAD-IIIC family phosphatase n=1 Tax=Ruegeria arenilitoris TaxID=1173585 RepID=UPI001CFCC8C1|nr:HAD-IIIC family phosphatase [Ruegeria arenilitoris]